MSEIVLFTQRVEIFESYEERRDCADQRIAEFIRMCDFLPIPVPNNVDVVSELIEKVEPSGIILTGGNSLVKYGGNAPERDDTDRALINFAIKKGIPLYGFCRGMQSILDFFNCKLVQVDGHVAVRHEIGGTEISYTVNSYHNQGCVSIETSSELEVVMRANDGVIEKIRHKVLPIIGTMWHPEREESFKDSDIEMVKELFRRSI